MKTEYIYNINPDDENRVKLFVGEGGNLIQSDINSFVYLGGFMGTQFNFKVPKFRKTYIPLQGQVSYVFDS